MAAKKLAVNTTIGGVTYEAGTTPPDEVAVQITNPAAWGGPSTTDESPTDSDEKKTAAKRSSK